MRDILSLCLGITGEILIVSRQKVPPTGTDDPVTSSLSLSLSLYEGEEIFFINEIFNFYLREGRDLSTLSGRGNVLMALSSLAEPQIAAADIPSGGSNKQQIINNRMGNLQ